jgi:nucleoside 2-deoxyribosyltransferase
MANKIDTCPFCNSALKEEAEEVIFGDINKQNDIRGFEYICPVCTNIRFTLNINLNKLNEIDKIKLRYYFRTREDKTYVLGSKVTLNEALNIPPYPTNLLDKIDLVLEYIRSETKFWGQEIVLNIKTDYILFFCKDRDELKEILNYLQSKKYISYRENPDKTWICVIRITPEGIKYSQELKKTTNFKKCFVAMWFDDKTKNLWNNIASLKEETGYSFYKIEINDENNGWIPDTIIKEIRRSKFMIADLTGYRAGVYYEAGFAEGLGLEVIYTCNKKWFDEKDEEMKIRVKCEHCEKEHLFKLDGVHFNLKQRKMILWEEDKLDEFKEALSAKIGAVIK